MPPLVEISVPLYWSYAMLMPFRSHLPTTSVELGFSTLRESEGHVHEHEDGFVTDFCGTCLSFMGIIESDCSAPITKFSRGLSF